jgi:hypothetical protein
MSRPVNSCSHGIILSTILTAHEFRRELVGAYIPRIMPVARGFRTSHELQGVSGN